MSKHPIISFVNDLLFTGGPIAITGLIVAIVVNSFYAVTAGWALSHVGKEIIEQIPSFAHAYSSTAVMLVILITWIIAARSHGFPTSIRGSSGHAMSSSGFGKGFLMQTPATSGSMHEAIVDNIFLISAITQAAPIPSVFPDKRKAQHRQAPKSFTFKIESIGDVFGIIVFSHLATPVSSVIRKAFGVSRTVRLLLFYHNEGV